MFPRIADDMLHSLLSYKVLILVESYTRPGHLSDDTTSLCFHLNAPCLRGRVGHECTKYVAGVGYYQIYNFI